MIYVACSIITIVCIAFVAAVVRGAINDEPLEKSEPPIDEFETFWHKDWHKSF